MPLNPDTQDTIQVSAEPLSQATRDTSLSTRSSPPNQTGLDLNYDLRSGSRHGDRAPHKSRNPFKAIVEGEREWNKLVNEMLKATQDLDYIEDERGSDKEPQDGVISPCPTCGCRSECAQGTRNAFGVLNSPVPIASHAPSIQDSSPLVRSYAPPSVHAPPQTLAPRTPRNTSPTEPIARPFILPVGSQAGRTIANYPQTSSTPSQLSNVWFDTLRDLSPPLSPTPTSRYRLHSNPAPNPSYHLREGPSGAPHPNVALQRVPLSWQCSKCYPGPPGSPYLT